MSTYNPRRGVNVSQYIANLNTVPPADEHIESPTNTNIEEDLALFTSNEFMDWDGTSGFGQSSTAFDLNFDQQPAATTGADISEPKLDFDLNGKQTIFSSVPFSILSLLLPPPLHHRLQLLLLSLLFSPCIIPNGRIPCSFGPISGRPGLLYTPPNGALSHVAPHASGAIRSLLHPVGDGRLTRPRAAPCFSWVLPLHFAGTAHSCTGARNLPQTLSEPHILLLHRDSASSLVSSTPTMTDFDPFAANFDFTDFNFQNPIVDQPMQPLPQTQHNQYPVPAAFTSPPPAVSPVGPGFDAAPGKKRKMSGFETATQQSIDEAARQAAEEDKRRRNTAASARFRIKKKQREQALEKTAKEMSERVTMLETRIQQLETENTWLKSLITEKNGGKLSNPDISAMLKKREENSGERIDGNRTDGVGTKSDVKA
jgi:hypothetical protein